MAFRAEGGFLWHIIHFMYVIFYKIFVFNAKYLGGTSLIREVQVILASSKKSDTKTFKIFSGPGYKPFFG